MLIRKLTLFLIFLIVLHGIDSHEMEQESQFESKTKSAYSTRPIPTDDATCNDEELKLWSLNNFPDINSPECTSHEGNDGATAICDPDKILRKFEYEKIKSLGSLFQYLNVECLDRGQYKFTYDEEEINEIESFTGEEKEYSESKAPIELAVVIIRKVSCLQDCLSC